MKQWVQTNPSPFRSMGKRLVGATGGEEEGSEVPEPLKVGPTVFSKLVGQVIQVGDAIFDQSRVVEHQVPQDYRGNTQRTR